MKAKNWLIGGLLLVATSLGATTENLLRISMKDGGESTFAIDNIQKIVFEGESSMVIQCVDETQRFDLSALQNVRFSLPATAIKPDTRLVTSQPLTIFPNPVDETLHLSFSQALSEEGTVQVFDLNGRLALVSSLSAVGVSTTGDAGSREVAVEVGSLAKGLYLCRVIMGGTARTATFIKK